MDKAFTFIRGWIMPLAALLPAVTLAACGTQPVPLPTDTSPKRIVSLNPCTDALLVELAQPERIAALSHYSAEPRASSIPQSVAQRFDVTGGTAEEVAALKPDLVLASDLLAPATRSALERLGIRVETFGIAGSVEASKAQVSRLADLLGRKSAGANLAARIDSALAQAIPQSGASPVVAAVWQQGGIVAGQDALISQLLRQTGFASHAAARGMGQGDFLSLEEVLADPPELLLIAGSSAAQSHPALGGVAATRVEPLDPSLLYCGGPTIIAAAQRLRDLRDLGDLAQ